MQGFPLLCLCVFYVRSVVRSLCLCLVAQPARLMHMEGKVFGCHFHRDEKSCFVFAGAYSVLVVTTGSTSLLFSPR